MLAPTSNGESVTTLSAPGALSLGAVSTGMRLFVASAGAGAGAAGAFCAGRLERKPPRATTMTMQRPQVADGQVAFMGLFGAGHSFRANAVISYRI